MACDINWIKILYELTSQSSTEKHPKKDHENIEMKNFLLYREKKIYKGNCKFLENNFCLLNEDLFCENVHIVNFHLNISVAST